MKANLFILLILCFILTIQTDAQSKTINLNELVGTYSSGHSFGGSYVTLKSDGSYDVGQFDCTNEYNQSGTYFLNSGVLHFTILKYITNSHGSSVETDLLNPAQSQDSLDNKSDEIHKNFELIPVKWSNRMYLMYESALKDFCDAVNFGIEPRKSLSSDFYFGAIYLRDGDETKSVTGMPLLPDEWSSFLLKKPITASVIKVEGEKGEKIATINKGSNDGLKVGIKLIGENQEPDLWFSFKVLSVEKRTAKVQVFDKVKIGDKLTTKFVPPVYYR